MSEARLSSKGQITAPPDIRERLKLKPGDNLRFRIADNGQVVVEGADVALAALHDYRRSTAGFTDCLIGHRNAAHGCNETGSFDKRAKGVAGLKML